MSYALSAMGYEPFHFVIRTNSKMTGPNMIAMLTGKKKTSIGRSILCWPQGSPGFTRKRVTTKHHRADRFRGQWMAKGVAHQLREGPVEEAGDA
jgi:hypothetical protein